MRVHILDWIKFIKMNDKFVVIVLIVQSKKEWAIAYTSLKSAFFSII